MVCIGNKLVGQVFIHKDKDYYYFDKLELLQPQFDCSGRYQFFLNTYSIFLYKINIYQLYPEVTYYSKNIFTFLSLLQRRKFRL